MTLVKSLQKSSIFKHFRSPIAGFGSEAGVLSDTSSDSGVMEDHHHVRVLASPHYARTLASPGLDDGPTTRPLLSPAAYSPENSVDLIDYLSNGT